MISHYCSLSVCYFHLYCNVFKSDSMIVQRILRGVLHSGKVLNPVNFILQILSDSRYFKVDGSWMFVGA